MTTHRRPQSDTWTDHELRTDALEVISRSALQPRREPVSPRALIRPTTSMGEVAVLAKAMALGAGALLFLAVIFGSSSPGFAVVLGATMVLVGYGAARREKDQ